MFQSRLFTFGYWLSSNTGAEVQVPKAWPWPTPVAHPNHKHNNKLRNSLQNTVSSHTYPLSRYLFPGVLHHDTLMMSTGELVPSRPKSMIHLTFWTWWNEWKSEVNFVYAFLVSKDILSINWIWTFYTPRLILFGIMRVVAG